MPDALKNSRGELCIRTYVCLFSLICILSHSFMFLPFFSFLFPPFVISSIPPLLLLTVWDLGGQTSIRPYWRCYYANTDAIIYVVDSADRDRLAISKSELVSMLEVRKSQKYMYVYITFATVPLLVYYRLYTSDMYVQYIMSQKVTVSILFKWWGHAKIKFVFFASIHFVMCS